MSIFNIVNNNFNQKDSGQAKVVLKCETEKEL